MRLILIVVAALFLAGCVAAVPPAIVVGGYALDGASLATSGKTMSDHAISGIANRDCALWRVVEGTPVCQHYADDVHGGGGGEGNAGVATAEGFYVSPQPGPSLDPTPLGTVREVAPDPQAWAQVERTVDDLRLKLGRESDLGPSSGEPDCVSGAPGCAATTSAWPFRAPD